MRCTEKEKLKKDTSDHKSVLCPCGLQIIYTMILLIYVNI